MRVEFEFDQSKAQHHGYSKEQIHGVVRAKFQECGLLCATDENILAFEDSGRKDDYSNMWNLIVLLFNSGWFLQCATACRWFEDADDNEPEDVLAQAWKLVRKPV